MKRIVSDLVYISVLLIWKLNDIFRMVQDPQNVHFYDKRGIEVDEKGHSLLLSRRTKLTSKLSRVTALAYPVGNLNGFLNAN